MPPEKPQSRIEDRICGAKGVLDCGIFPSPAPTKRPRSQVPEPFIISGFAEITADAWDQTIKNTHLD